MHLLPSLMSYWVEHLKRNSISTPVHLSMYYSLCFYPINVALCYVCKRMKGRGRGGGGEGGGEGKKFGKFLDNKY